MSPESPLRWHYGEFDEGNFRIHGRTLYFILVLFSIILSINFLFFFSRWACRRFCHRPRPRPHSTPLHHPLPPPPPRGLDLTSINSLQILLYKSTGSDVDAGKITETECCICIGPFKEGDKMKMLPECKHCFHSECVDEWLSAQSSCPLCRTSLV